MAKRYGLILPGFEKIADLDLPGVSSAPQGGSARQQGTGSGGSTSSTSTSGSSAKRVDIVRTMQGIMAKLRDELQFDAKAQNAFSRINANTQNKPPQELKDAASVKSFSQSFGSTSAGGLTGTLDGIWGPNTTKALLKIKDFITKGNIKGVILTESPSGKDEEVIKLAQDNITNLARLFGAVGLDAPESAMNQGGSGYKLDSVDEQLSNLANRPNPWPKYWGAKPVTVGDVKNIETFFVMIQGLRYTKCQPLSGGEGQKPSARPRVSEKPRASERLSIQNPRGAVRASLNPDLEKLAKEILDESIFKLAQDNEPPSGHCFSTISDFITWFMIRARSVFNQISTLRDSASPHPVFENRAVTDTDVKAAQFYMDSMQDIYREWGSIAGRIEKILRDKGWDGQNGHPMPIVTYDILMQVATSSGYGGIGGTGGTGGSRGRGRGAGGTGSTVEGDAGVNVNDGPIQRYMPLENILNENTNFRADAGILERLRQLSAGGKLPNLDQRTWSSGSWISLADRYIEGANDAEKLRIFPEWAGLIRDLIQSLFRNWQTDAGDAIDQQTILRRQDTMTDTWTQYINSKIRTAQNNMAEAVNRRETGVATNPNRQASYQGYAPSSAPQSTQVYEGGNNYYGGGYYGGGNVNVYNGGGARGGDHRQPPPGLPVQHQPRPAPGHGRRR